MRLSKRFRKHMASAMVAAMLVGGVNYAPFVQTVYAQQVPGDAPFINSWLVAGPFETSVADEIYDIETIQNPNLAPKSKVTVSSNYGDTNPPEYIHDGSIKRQWVTAPGDKEPWVNFSWEEPTTIGKLSIAEWGDALHINQHYTVTFTLEDGTTTEPIKIDSTSKDPNKPTIYNFKRPIQGVKEMKVEVDKGITGFTLTGISELEIYQYGDEEENGGTERPEDGNWARVAQASASSQWQTGPIDYPGDSPASFSASKAIDGNKGTEWISQMHDKAGAPSTWPKWDPTPTLYLEWQQPIKVKEIQVFDRYDPAWPEGISDVQKVICTLKDDKGTVLEVGEITEIDTQGKTPGVVVFETAIEGVSKVELLIVHDGEKNMKNVALGFKEVNVFDGDGFIVPPLPPEPEEKITPQLGETFGTDQDERTWEYFDDRIWNRSYDDYQDLYGYYTVKKGIDTQNKYVYAHTYVYSPKEQEAYVNIGASGSYKVFVNDIQMTKPSNPTEVQKDLTKKRITLKEGWNKVLLQIEHTFTEDLGPNGIPVAEDQHVAYLGFYGRIADVNDNEIDGLIYSVKGETEELEIVTQGLSTEDSIQNSLPTNNMPIGYKEWPYVWNKSTGNNKYGVSATGFQFMASGGTPGYKWEIVDGELPLGLALNEDGTIADGIVNGKVDLNSDKGIISVDCEPGDYTFTVQVTDGKGQKATKDFTITVKERPNKWVEEGKISALTHTIVTYGYFVDENYSVDLWAERARRQGHSLLTVETNQQNYYWPSKFSDPNNERGKYYPKDENGQLLDGIKPFEEAVKRNDMELGLYYASRPTDQAVQELTDLIERYDPVYLYFDGPQFYGDQNFDVIYSSIRNLNEDIIVNSNAWGEEYGDVDLRTGEASHIYSSVNRNHTVKKTTMEPWKTAVSKNNYTPYYAQRDDYREIIKEMIMNTGRGYTDNIDQMPLMSRGTNWDSPQDVATRYPKSVQEYISIREAFADWFVPEGKPERHEATTGTTPYFLAGYGYEDNGKGNYDNFAHPNANVGPQWGYATSRDNNVYLHIIEGPDGKKGFDAIEGKSLTISPIKDTVTSVSWLNEGVPVTSFSQDGESLTINFENVIEDPVDTIIKITTDNPERKYQLTDIKLTGNQLTPNELKLNAEGYMTFTALKAPLEEVIYTSLDTSVATVDVEGIVRPVGDGTTTIGVSGSYEGVTKEDEIKVRVRDGKVYVAEEMIGATLKVDGKESFGEFNTEESFGYEIKGRSAKGGEIGLHDAEITWHGGIVDLQAGDKYKPVVINEVDTFTFEEGQVRTPYVEKNTRGAVWAEVTLDGKSFTTNKVFMDLMPYQNLAIDAEITASHDVENIANLTDGKTIYGLEYDQSKWSAKADEKAEIEFKLPAVSDIKNININFNTLERKYINTPKTMKIQVSDDGANWRDVSATNGPTGGTYFGFYNQYAINQEAQYVKLIFDGGSNGAMIDLLEVAINGFQKEEKQGILLSGANQIQGGKSFTMQVGLNGLKDTVYAEDITLNYDPEVFVLEKVEVEGTTELAGIKQDEEKGTITILTGSPNGVVEKADLLNVTFRAKDTENSKETAITAVGKLGVVESDVSSVVEVDLVSHNIQVEAGEVEQVDKAALEAAIQNAEQLHANAEEGTNPGQYPEGSKAKLMTAIETAKGVVNNATTQVEVDQALISLNQSVQEFIDSKIEDTSLVGDVNKDGKIDVADLGLVAYYYAVKEDDANWEQAKVADLDKDGNIGIKDLSFVASKILEK